MTRFMLTAPALWLAAVLAAAPAGARAEPLVFAAASTSGAVEELIAAYPGGASASYASSGLLARQIEQGAPADVFLSANPQWMTYLAERGLVDPNGVQPVLSNRLVLIAPHDGPLAAAGAPLAAEALSAALGDERFAMPDPAASPLGRYGQAALSALGLWDALSTRLAVTRNAPSTVALVSRGDAALGLSYATDVAGLEGVAIVAELPTDAHPEIVYLVAAASGGRDPDGASAFLDFLKSDVASEIFVRRGFVLRRASAEEGPR